MKHFTLITAVLLLFGIGCNKNLNIDPTLLTGKSKEDVIKLAFKESERILDNQVHFFILSSDNRYENHYFQSEKDAISSIAIANANKWGIFFTKNNTLLGCYQKYLWIEFEQGKVISVEVKERHDAM